MRLTRRLLVVTIFALAAATAGTATGARTISTAQLVLAPKTTTPDGGALYVLEVSGTPSCRLDAPGASDTADVVSADRLAFVVDVRPDAAPGPRRVTISCDGQVVYSGAVTVVLGPKPGRSPLLAKGVFHIAHDPSFSSAEAQASAQAQWARDGADYLASFRTGQCTDLATRLRPDVVERVYVARAAALLMAHPFPLLDFTALNWARLARAAGMAVGTTPQPGAVVVWQPGVDGAGRGTGHVGYVKSATATTFTTVEENWGGPYKTGSRTLSAKPERGRLFIYPSR